MKILITGANGLLGQWLVRLFSANTSYHVIATGKGFNRGGEAVESRYHPLDITNGVAVNALVNSFRPGMIIHAAALTQVDQCELEEVECWTVNVTATRFLIDAAKQVGAFFLFVSTDFVFDGEKGMYAEDDATGPVNYYGSSKLAAEKAVMESGLEWAIARTCLVYGNKLQGSRNNIATWVKENLEQHNPIRVVNDQLRTPTYVEDLAKGITLIAGKKAKGIFHLSGAEAMTPYDMAVATAGILQLDKDLISKTNALNFTQPAKRPAKTGFNITKAKSLLGFEPISFAEGLKKMFGQNL